MSDGIVQVKFRRPYQVYKAGQIIQMTAGQAHSMQHLFGLVDIVTEPQLELAIAPEPVVERAVAPAAKAPRKRRGTA